MSVSDCTSAPGARQSSLYPAPFLVAPANLLVDQVCPSAQSLLARQISGGPSLLIGLGCKRWTCRFCAAVKIRKLSWLTARAAPSRLLTLTVNNRLYSNPRAAFDATRAFVPELIRFLRTRFGEVEYLRVTEVTRAGYPHYHLLVRSAFLPHAVVKKAWHEMTGAEIVDLRPVTKTFGAYNYLTKYLTKMHRLDWTERHVSYSRNFFPPLPPEQERPANLGDCQRMSLHPYDWLADKCMGLTLRQMQPMVWELDECPELLSQPRPDAF
jgi:hypothetical protein